MNIPELCHCFVQLILLFQKKRYVNKKIGFCFWLQNPKMGSGVHFPSLMRRSVLLRDSSYTLAGIIGALIFLPFKGEKLHLFLLSPPFSSLFSTLPTGHFTILELRIQEIVCFYGVQDRRTADFDAPKLWKGRSGSSNDTVFSAWNYNRKKKNEKKREREGRNPIFVVRKLERTSLELC